MTVGIGYDAHAFVPDRPLVIGGVTIPSERGLAGHSDADVLTHAIADAILGAGGLGDLGRHFPSSDPRWAGASSLAFLSMITQMLETVWMKVVSIDATVIIESPPIAPHRDDMRIAIAHALQVPTDSISVKATTNDGMGFIGRGEGAAAMAVAMLGSTTLSGTSLG